MRVYAIESEWDIGINDLFATRNLAKKAIESNPVLREIAEDNNTDVAGLMADRLVNIIEKQVIEY